MSIVHNGFDFLRAHSLPTDRIFVWGFYPDFYVYADRASASRYIYASFQTGVQPGKNIAPGVNTDDVVTPGALDALMQELEAKRPVFFVDSSLGPQRFFDKYPLSRYPRLAAFVEANYVEVEPVAFRPHGFRVLMIKDAARRTPPPPAGGPAEGQLDEPVVMGVTATEPLPRDYLVQATHTAGRLQRVELLVNDAPLDGISFRSAAGLNARFQVHFEKLGHGKYRLAARTTSASGEVRTGPAIVVECAAESLTAEQREAFALPTLTRGVVPDQVRSLFSSGAQREAGVMRYFAHAPSVITYPLKPGPTQLSGRFGFLPGAYAATNASRTDGAVFIITWIGPAGQRTELMRRWLRPSEVVADQGEQPFVCLLPAGHKEGTLELSINEGPAGNPSSDWTYWADLQLADLH